MKVIIAIVGILLPLLSFSQDQDVPTSRAPLTQTEVPKENNRWGATIEMWWETYANKLKREDWLDIMLIRPYYKLTDSSNISIGQELLHSLGASDEKPGGRFTVLDTYVQYANSDITSFGFWKIQGYFRPYFPTSEASQNPIAGRNLMIRAQVSATYPLTSQIRVGYYLEPRAFFQKNQSVGDVQNEQYRIKHWLGATANLQKFLGYQFVGLTSRYFHENGPQEDDLYWETGVGYQFSGNFVLYAGAYTEVSNDIRQKNFVFFDENDYLYFLDGILTF